MWLTPPPYKKQKVEEALRSFGGQQQRQVHQSTVAIYQMILTHKDISEFNQLCFPPTIDSICITTI